MKDHIAGVIRKVTVPPVLAAVMLLIFRGVFGERFISVPLFVVELGTDLSGHCAGQRVSAFHAGRKGKRRTGNAAETCICHQFSWIWSGTCNRDCRGSGRDALAILWGYFLAVIVLTFLNKIGKIRASGHACSCTLPYLFFCQFLGIRAAVVCAPLYLAEFWASVRLKRHTVKEFLTGSLTALVVFLLVRN